MTDRERAIVMAYTGACMLTGDKLGIFYKYVEEIMGRPVSTFEMAYCSETIKGKAKADFIELCRNEHDSEQVPKTEGWISVSEKLPGKENYYCTTTSNHEVYCDYWSGERFDRTEQVIAWMPLPEPYKGKR